MSRPPVEHREVLIIGAGPAGTARPPSSRSLVMMCWCSIGGQWSGIPHSAGNASPIGVRWSGRSATSMTMIGWHPTSSGLIGSFPSASITCGSSSPRVRRSGSSWIASRARDSNSTGFSLNVRSRRVLRFGWRWRSRRCHDNGISIGSSTSPRQGGSLRISWSTPRVRSLMLHD